MAPFRRAGNKPVTPVLPLKLRAKDMEIDRLIQQADALTDQLKETVASISEILRTHQDYEEGGKHGVPGA
jgi:hypothetical protein